MVAFLDAGRAVGAAKRHSAGIVLCVVRSNSEYHGYRWRGDARAPILGYARHFPTHPALRPAIPDDQRRDGVRTAILVAGVRGGARGAIGGGASRRPERPGSEPPTRQGLNQVCKKTSALVSMSPVATLTPR